MIFKIGDKIEVVKVFTGLASKGDRGVIVTRGSWHNNRTNLKYSLEKQYYELRKLGTNPNNNIIIKEE